MKVFQFIFLLFSFNAAHAANAIFYFNAEAASVYEKMLNGKTIAAKESISAYKKQQPENLIWLWLEDYNEFINLYFSESETDFKTYVANNEQHLSVLKKATSKNAWHRYAIAENYLHLAFAQFMFEEYVSGFWNMRRAYLLLEENQKAYPEFLGNQKNIALIQALTGILPDKYHWVLNVLGIEASLTKGTAQLKKLATQKDATFNFSNEAILMYGILLFHTGDEKEKAIVFFQQQKFPSAENLTGNISLANLLLHSNQNAQARQLLKNIPATSAYPKVALVEYLKGMQQLQTLNSKQAITHFRNYLLQTKSKHLIKSSYHKLAWCYLLENNRQQYEKNMAEIAKTGKDIREADKQAVKAYEKIELPNTNLLKARLLFDAGNYNKALEVLNTVEIDAKNKLLETEWIYRKARVYDKMNDPKKALQLYDETLKKGSSLPYYYAANAALQAGYIYEQQGDKKKATQYFEKCLSLQDHEYVNSLSQKAKAALKRLQE